ncbi:MAG: hypothetical protein K2O01_03890 [Bacteroidales bacterium]|nr:hypothetical protein [Bacteroidales bacterium]
MFKHNQFKEQGVYGAPALCDRRMVRPLLVIAALFAFTPLRAMIPPQYTDNANYKAKGAVQRIVVKTFGAIDKADHVELGEMQEHPVIVEYSGSGNLARVVELNQKGDILFYFTTEEKDGRPSSHKRYSNKEWMDAYSTFSYNKDKLESESVYNAEGELFYTEVYTYNKAGQLLNVTRRNPRGEKLQTVEYAYDGAGNRVMERMKSKEDRFVYEKKMTYDGQGRLAGEEYLNQEGLLKSKNAYTYNAQGDIDHVRQGVPGGAVSTMRIVYDYDAQDNWTRCTVYASDYVPTTVITRLIEYR